MQRADPWSDLALHLVLASPPSSSGRQVGDDTPYVYCGLIPHAGKFVNGQTATLCWGSTYIVGMRRPNTAGAEPSYSLVYNKVCPLSERT